MFLFHSNPWNIEEWGVSSILKSSCCYWLAFRLVVSLIQNYSVMRQMKIINNFVCNFLKNLMAVVWTSVFRINKLYNLKAPMLWVKVRASFSTDTIFPRDLTWKYCNFYYLFLRNYHQLKHRRTRLFPLMDELTL